MTDIALRVEGLGKRYRIGLRDSSAGGRYRYKSLRDSLGGLAKRPLRSVLDALVREPMNEVNSFWALKNVDFEIKKGGMVGIIGRNGAGKSTLLKILSRITKPTAGHVAIYGRVGSLLEVGTGFHPELSGRENVFLNGAVLGMTRAEVKAKFDEIVAFSEIEKFLDTPVKHYSSGMYTRLAFAVAAHLEPDILVVDEVLAVGDALFQKKCIGKMGEVAREGRTVLFVSHQMGTVAQLCAEAILLSRGSVAAAGTAGKIIMSYLQQQCPTGAFFRRGLPDHEMFFTEAVTTTATGAVTSSYAHDEAIRLTFVCAAPRPVPEAVAGVVVTDRHDRKVFTAQASIGVVAPRFDERLAGTLEIPGLFLTPGDYRFTLALHVPKVRVIDHIERVCAIHIDDVGSDFSNYEGADYGCVFPPAGLVMSKTTTGRGNDEDDFVSRPIGYPAR
jgi:lipopolysaccharide transport system ATP-binding protein